MELPRIMPSGKFKGTTIASLPPAYLQYYHLMFMTLREGSNNLYRVIDTTEAIKTIINKTDELLRTGEKSFEIEGNIIDDNDVIDFTLLLSFVERMKNRLRQFSWRLLTKKLEFLCSFIECLPKSDDESCLVLESMFCKINEIWKDTDIQINFNRELGKFPGKIFFNSYNAKLYTKYFPMDQN